LPVRRRNAGLRRIGYLCSEFPALSHTFISREISVLESEGFEILTVSVNPTRDLEKMGKDDRAYAARTYCIKATPKPRIALTLVRYALRARRFWSALAFSSRLAGRGGPRDIGKAIGFFVEAVLLHAWAERSGIRHVHVHFANPAATVALIATRMGELEYSLSVHGPDEFYDVDRNNLREKIEGAVFVRCIGYFCRSQLMRLSPIDQWRKFHIVRCGIFKDEFRRRPARRGAIRKILCVGRLCPSKGQAILVDAASRLRDKGLAFQLLFLGGGEDEESIRSMVAERGLQGLVSVPGPVGHQRVKDELVDCDLFVLPSFAEGIPVALMEAMASGVPVISTRIAGIPELIEHGVEGVLVHPSSVEHLSSAIESFLLGEVDVEGLVERAADKVAAAYDAEANAKALGELFLESRRLA
jgi:colanic acid/amylovoran biosynthesis glycosyltransferase